MEIYWTNDAVESRQLNRRLLQLRNRNVVSTRKFMRVKMLDSAHNVCKDAARARGNAARRAASAIGRGIFGIMCAEPEKTP